MSYYDQSGQKVILIPETAFGTPKGGTAWTNLTATYAYGFRLDIIDSVIDFDFPVRKKEPIYEIGEGKHPTYLVNKQIEPTEFSIEFKLNKGNLAAMAMAGSTGVSIAGNVAEISTITCLAKESISNGDYFWLMEATDAVGGYELHYFWFDVDTGGSDPACEEGTATEVAIDGDTTDIQVASRLVTAINSVFAGTPAANAGGTSATVTVTQGFAGAVRKPHDGAATTGFTFGVTTEGVNTYTITEGTNRTAKSFTLHIEQDNGSEDIVADFFGCIIKSIEITMEKDASNITASVTFMSPYALFGTVFTNPPPYDKIEPFTWNMIDDESNYNIVEENSNSKKPEATESVRLLIDNEVDMLGDVGEVHRVDYVVKKRSVELGLVGFSQTKDLIDFYKDIWDNENERYDTATTAISGTLQILESANNYIRIPFYNWYIDAHSLQIFTIDEAIRGIDVTFKDGPANSDSVWFIDSSDNKVIIKCQLDPQYFGE